MLFTQFTRNKRNARTHAVIFSNYHNTSQDSGEGRENDSQYYKKKRKNIMSEKQEAVLKTCTNA